MKSKQANHVQHWELQYQTHLNNFEGMKEIITQKYFLIWEEKISLKKKKESQNLIRASWCLTECSLALCAKV